MRSSLIEGDHRSLEKLGELFLVKDQEVIQTFSSHAPQKAFTDGIRLGVRYGVRSILMPLVEATRPNCGPNLRSLSRIKYCGVCPYGVASRRGTRDPSVARGSGHIDVDDLARLKLDDEESKQWTEEEIRHLQAHHKPRSLPHDCARTFSSSAHRLVWGEYPSYPSESSV
jgi:hypothetical protein